MNRQIENSLQWLQAHPQLQAALAVPVLVLVAWLSNFIVKRVLVRGIDRLFQNGSASQQLIGPNNAIINRLANVVPALVISLGISLVPSGSEAALEAWERGQRLAGRELLLLVIRLELLFLRREILIRQRWAA